jgi:hypothetical protein
MSRPDPHLVRPGSPGSCTPAGAGGFRRREVVLSSALGLEESAALVISSQKIRMYCTDTAGRSSQVPMDEEEKLQWGNPICLPRSTGENSVDLTTRAQNSKAGGSIPTASDTVPDTVKSAVEDRSDRTDSSAAPARTFEVAPSISGSTP